MFGGGWNTCMNVHLIFLSGFGENEKKNSEVLLIPVFWLQEMEIQLKLALQPKRQCVGWEVWDMYLASSIVRSGTQFVTPELSPSSSLHSSLLGFNLRFFLHRTARHLFIAPSTICPSISWFWKKKETLFQFSQYQTSWKCSGGTCLSHVLIAEPITMTEVKSYSDWPIVGHVPTLKSRQTELMFYHHGGRDSFPKEERLAGTQGWLAQKTLTSWKP